MSNEINRIVDGHRGYSHITSQKIADLNAATMGNGNYVYSVGSELRLEMIGTTAIKIYDGVWSIQGRRGVIDNGDSETLSLKSGTQGATRSDFVIIRYERDASESNIETMKLMVISGNPNGGDPIINNDTVIRDGATVHDMPIYRKRSNGINIDGVDKLFDSQGMFSPIVEMMHPVGHVLFTYNEANPVTYLGFGSWERVKGKFLVGVDENDSIMSTAGLLGGSKDAVIPSHNHTFNGYTMGGHYHTTNSAGAHYHTTAIHWNQNYYGSGTKNAYAHNAGSVINKTSSSAGAHSHTTTNVSAGVPTGTISTTGVEATNKNLPPFETVYIWKRIA